jgi:ferric-dicitrate binding protein FerR (iron transport regulator)
MQMSNDLMRRKLQALARQDIEGLDPAARNRIIQRVVAAAPLEMRRARTVRLAAGGGIALAAAAAVALFVGMGTSVLSSGSSAPAAQNAQDLPSAPTFAGACADRSLPTSLGFVERNSEQVLEVADLARVVASAGSRVALEHAEACKLAVKLDVGSVAVASPDLRGGELRVVAHGAELVTRGAVFRVTQSDSELGVEVTQGRVLLERAGQARREIASGHRLQVSANGIVEGALAR